MIRGCIPLAKGARGMFHRMCHTALSFRTFYVIQTTEGRKNLEYIKWVSPRSFTPLRSVLDDKGEVCALASGI